MAKTRTVYVPETGLNVDLPTEKEIINILIKAEHSPEAKKPAATLFKSLGIDGRELGRADAIKREEVIRARIQELTGRRMSKNYSVQNQRGEVRRYCIS